MIIGSLGWFYFSTYTGCCDCSVWQLATGQSENPNAFILCDYKVACGNRTYNKVNCWILGKFYR